MTRRTENERVNKTTTTLSYGVFNVAAETNYVCLLNRRLLPRVENISGDATRAK